MQWDDATAEYAKRRYFIDGADGDVVAAELSAMCGAEVTASSVYGALYRSFPALRYGKRSRLNEKNGVRNEAIRADIAAGMSQSAAAKKYGLSRQRICEIAPSPGHVTEASILKRLATAGVDVGPRWARECDIDMTLEGEITTAGKTFLELADGECRFSFGKDADGGYRFCGCARHGRSPYCESHHVLTHMPPGANDNRSLGGKAHYAMYGESRPWKRVINKLTPHVIFEEAA